MNKKYFFCYSENVMKFLKSNGIKYITEAKHVKTDKIFWLYEGTKELNELLDIWNNKK